MSNMTTEAMNISREESINNLVTLLHDTREALLSGTRGVLL